MALVAPGSLAGFQSQMDAPLSPGGLTALLAQMVQMGRLLAQMDLVQLRAEEKRDVARVLRSVPDEKEQLQLSRGSVSQVVRDWGGDSDGGQPFSQS